MRSIGMIGPRAARAATALAAVTALAIILWASAGCTADNSADNPADSSADSTADSTADSSARISVQEAELLVREYALVEYMELDEDTVFEVEELEVQDLWETMQMQLFHADYSQDGMWTGEDYFFYRDRRLSGLGPNTLLSAAVADSGLYYTVCWGSGIFYQAIERLSFENGRPSTLHFSPLEGSTPSTALFVREVEGRIQWGVGDWSGGFNSWASGADVQPLGWVEPRYHGSDLVGLDVVDEAGEPIDPEALNAELAAREQPVDPPVD
jgi:hypothetical protein